MAARRCLLSTDRVLHLLRRRTGQEHNLELGLGGRWAFLAGWEVGVAVLLFDLAVALQRLGLVLGLEANRSSRWLADGRFHLHAVLGHQARGVLGVVADRLRYPDRPLGEVIQGKDQGLAYVGDVFIGPI